MSQLQTYDRTYSLVADDAGKMKQRAQPWPIVLAGGCGQPGCDDLKPGDTVTHRDWGGTGLLVGITADHLTILWSEQPHVSGVGQFVPPLVRRVQPQSIAKQIVSVQPMTAPSGSVFYYDYSYPDVHWQERCNMGPWWRRVFWRVVLCMRTLTRRFGSWLRSWRRSSSQIRGGIADIDYHREVQERQLAEVLKHLNGVASPSYTTVPDGRPPADPLPPSG